MFLEKFRESLSATEGERRFRPKKWLPERDAEDPLSRVKGIWQSGPGLDAIVRLLNTFRPERDILVSGSAFQIHDQLYV
jgi:hypothetical protein